VKPIRAVALGLLFAAIVVACSTRGNALAPPRGPPPEDPAWLMRNDITALWTQIRAFRKEAGMDLDPLPANEIAVARMSVQQAKRVCPEGHAVPTTCGDVCSLAEAICDNADAICGLADDLAKLLGRPDKYAVDKCTNAKASCREAKQRCCEKCPKESAP